MPTNEARGEIEDHLCESSSPWPLKMSSDQLCARSRADEYEAKSSIGHDYAVRVESGTERDTVRAKLWTPDERAAEAAAKVCVCLRARNQSEVGLILVSPSLPQLQREAEIEADACAAALLRDEGAAKKPLSSKSRQRRPAKKES